MPWWSLALIMVTVTVVSVVRPVSLQSTLYSLPIPLTLGLLGSGQTVSKAQPLSVLGVVLFFYLVAILRLRGKWPSYPSSIASALVVLGALELLALWSPRTVVVPATLAVTFWVVTSSIV